MAKLQVNAKISVRHNKLNKRYTAEIIDYRKAITFGLEPLEAVDVAEQLLIIASEYEHPSVVEALDRVFDQIDQNRQDA